MINTEKKEIIVVDHLTKDYGYHRGVFDVSITVHEGECYGYLGPNGAGKSTTIRHIMGFSKPQKGTITMFGKSVFNNTKELLKKVGYLPGEVALPSGLTGWGFLRMMQGLRDVYNEERLEYLLDLFKLDPSLDTKLMSLGDKRKLAVVAAFMHDPELLILDEPTSGLDPVMQHTFIEFIKNEKKRGKAILLSSHIFSEVDETCDTISIIKDGIHVSTFKAEELKNTDDITYILYMRDKNNFDNLLLDNSFNIAFSNENKLTIGVIVNKDNINDFFKKLKAYKFDGFEEKKFSLQDYFMSFYKENKEFQGLSGIKDNDKGGEKNGK